MSRRAAVAIAASALPLLAHVGSWGINIGYAWSLPALVGAAILLLRGALQEDGASGRRAPEAARVAAPFALALLLLAPALGASRWRTLLALTDAPFLDPWGAIYGCVRLAGDALRDAGPLLGGAGLAAAVLGGPRVATLTGALLGGAVGATLGWLGLEAVNQALRDSDPSTASLLARMAPWSGSMAAVGAVFGWGLRRRLAPGLVPRAGSGLLVLCAVGGAGWAATPPLSVALGALTSPASVLPVPEGAPGASPALPAKDPTDPHLEKWLTARGHPPIRDPDDLCQPPTETAWEKRLRATELLAIPEAERSEALLRAATRLIAHGVTRVGLLGRAPPQSGPLGSWLAWPSAQFILDGPPLDATPWFLDESGLHRLGKQTGGGRCALVTTPGVSIAQLYAAGRTLGGPGPNTSCRGAVALVVPTELPKQLDAQWAAELIDERRCP